MEDHSGLGQSSLQDLYPGSPHLPILPYCAIVVKLVLFTHCPIVELWSRLQCVDCESLWYQGMHGLQANCNCYMKPTQCDRGRRLIVCKGVLERCVFVHTKAAVKFDEGSILSWLHDLLMHLSWFSTPPGAVNTNIMQMRSKVNQHTMQQK